MHFPHRMNRDGTIDSICPRCYITVGTSTCQPDLERMEAAHICEPALLNYYEEQLKKRMKQPPHKEPSQRFETIQRFG